MNWLEEATIDDVQTGMEEGRLSAYHLALYYIQRIAQLDTAGPKLNSILELNPDAVFIAKALDQEREEKGPRSRLHGIPILLKDNIDTGDKMHTSAGSLALEHSYAAADAHLVDRLRAAGAVILGKTNMTEWANFMTRGMKNGYSSRGGQVLNPYGPGQLDVGGSSSGSGAAIAANLAMAAVGTETSGSILSPCHRNSLVGIKPTVGLISRQGIIPIAHSQDTAGPMTRTVQDAAILLSVMAGKDDADPATWLNDNRLPLDYTRFLDQDGLHGARVGVPRQPYYDRLSDAQMAMMQNALAVMQQAGAIIVDPVRIPSANIRSNSKVMLYEFKSGLNAYLANCSAHVPVHSLRDLILYNQANATSMLKYGQSLLLEAEATSGRLTEPDYIRSRLHDLQISRTDGIDAVIDEYQLDALVFPGAWGCSLAAKAGYPAITVPGGYAETDGPLGITWVARAYQEPLLIQLGYAFEQATQYRLPPQLD